MNRTRTWAVALLVVGLVASARAEPLVRTNIVLIMADDMGFSDLGCYGSEIPTPRIDALAAKGLRFTQFYNAARCCPTRACLLTGLYPHQAGVGHMVQDLGRPAYRGELQPQCVTLAEVLKQAGYRTMMAGKWHVAPATGSKANWPLQRGFDRFFGLIGSVRSYYDPPTLTRGNDPATPGPGFYLTDAITDEAVSALEEAGRQTDPFFLYVAYTAPHWPLHAPPEAIARVGDRYRGGWDALRSARHKRMVEMGLVKPEWSLAARDPDAPAWTDAPHPAWQAQRMAVYAAMIEKLDRGVGRIVDELTKQGMLDSTLLLFLADNGGCAEEIQASWRGRLFAEKLRDGRPARVGNDPAVSPGPDDVLQSYGLPWANASNTPFRLFKHWVHEGGISTPFIVHWPGAIREPAIRQESGHIVDVMATCVEVAGATYPETYRGRRILPTEGKSLLPLFRGKPREAQPALYWEHEGNRAVREGTWKLVSRHGKPWELYDLSADRTETHDLSAKQPDRVRHMTDLYDRWAARVGVAPWDEVNPER